MCGASPRRSFATMPNQTLSPEDQELKARHRAMWASGNYPTMVETFLTPLGPRLVEACRVGAGVSVLDVASGTGNAAIPAAQQGAHVTASDLTPELLQAGARRAAGRRRRARLGDRRRRAPARSRTSPSTS